MVRDRLALGCKDSAARTRLFREKSCDLKKAVESPRVSEATSEQLKEIEGNGMHEPINYVDKQPPRKPPLQKKSDRTKKKGDGNTSDWKSRECIYCGGIHEHNKNKCPAFGKTCRKCGTPIHFQSVCFHRQSIHNMQEESASEDEPVYCIESV